MIRNSIVTLSCLLLSACGGETGAAGSAAASGKPAASAKSSAAPAATSAAPSAAPTADAAKPAELEEIKNEKFGYSLMLPKGSKNESPDESTGGVYAAGKLAIMVTPLAKPAASPDDLLRGLNVEGAKVEKKTEADLFTAHVEKDTVTINFLATRKDAKFMVQCLGDVADKELAKTICSSVKVLKK